LRPANAFNKLGILYLAAAAVSCLAFSPDVAAESLAAKNREGNRLFAQGKYEDAERTYMEAQVKNPGNSKVLYNLGNTLIKQKKFDQGIKSLRQSIDKGDKDLRENSWYNTGNAMFSAGRFRNAADAYIRALELDPSDTDAKHNLELALLKLKQQDKQSGASQGKQDSGNQERNRPSSGGEEKQPQKQSQKDSGESGNTKGEKTRPDSRQAPESQRPGSMSREQAVQILDAVQSQELEQQRKVLEALARRKANGKDW
jgi:tetratricopeptide (TPR) repeat protein